jgi:signal transduction histidine kinase
LRNILSNAVKFTPKGGKIAIKCELKNKDVTVSITDSGTGIPDDELEMINNADKNYTDMLSGGRKSINLGLLLSRLQTELIGGSLTINTKQDLGTTVVIAIPQG